MVNPWPQTYLDFAWLLVFSATVLSFQYENTVISKLISKGSFFGDISFSIYMLHWIFLLYVNRFFGWEDQSIAKHLVYITCVLVASYLSFRLFERPTYHWLLRRIPSVRDR